RQCARREYRTGHQNRPSNRPNPVAQNCPSPAFGLRPQAPSPRRRGEDLKRHRRTPSPRLRGEGWGEGLYLLAPDLAGGFDDEAELRLFLLDRERVALDCRGEAALRRQAELLERHVFGGFVDAALELVFAFEGGA